jgi:hypothetical protein
LEQIYGAGRFSSGGAQYGSGYKRRLGDRFFGHSVLHVESLYRISIGQASHPRYKRLGAGDEPPKIPALDLCERKVRTYRVSFRVNVSIARGDFGNIVLTALAATSAVLISMTLSAAVLRL